MRIVALSFLLLACLASAQRYPCLWNHTFDIDENRKSVEFLASFPRSGSSMMRLLLDKTTGHHTGSIYNDGSLRSSGLKGEGICDAKHVRFVKSHAPQPPETLFQRNCAKKCDCRNITVSRLIHIVRNPYNALESFVHFKSTHHHHDTQRRTLFEGSAAESRRRLATKWKAHYCSVAQDEHTRCLGVKDTRPPSANSQWAIGAPLEYTRIRYEDVLTQPVREIHRALGHVDVSPSRRAEWLRRAVKCAVPTTLEPEHARQGYRPSSAATNTPHFGRVELFDALRELMCHLNYSAPGSASRSCAPIEWRRDNRLLGGVTTLPKGASLLRLVDAGAALRVYARLAPLRTEDGEHSATPIIEALHVTLRDERVLIAGNVSWRFASRQQCRSRMRFGRDNAFMDETRLRTKLHFGGVARLIIESSLIDEHHERIASVRVLLDADFAARARADEGLGGLLFEARGGGGDGSSGDDDDERLARHALAALPLDDRFDAVTPEARECEAEWRTIPIDASRGDDTAVLEVRPYDAPSLRCGGELALFKTCGSFIEDDTQWSSAVAAPEEALA